ncbi:MAG TPA: class I SAM-dependent methyltransferase [Anaerolineae bacterium]|nr:class I SAM-dependent methyltransferase [Anaerolineae bacterium]
MAKQTPERLIWAVALLSVEPADRLLEIGCGPGEAVALICEKLNGGSITAIDRSEKMVARARQRNGGPLAAGKAVFQVAALSDITPGEECFDKIFAVNVNLFWTQPGSGLSPIKALLAPEGKLYLFYQPPSVDKIAPIVDKVTQALQANGFTTRDVLTQEMDPAPGVAIVAELKSRTVPAGSYKSLRR